MTPDEHAFIQATGEKLVGLISDDMQAAGFTDLQLVLNVLCSVLAHYISGVDDIGSRNVVFNEFGRALHEHLQRAPDGFRAHVIVGPVQ
jgi:hypothetical protein